MKTEDELWIASLAIGKNYKTQDIYDSDYLYSLDAIEKDEAFANICIYIKECKSIGTIAFKEKYKKFKLYL